MKIITKDKLSTYDWPAGAHGSLKYVARVLKLTAVVPPEPVSVKYMLELVDFPPPKIVYFKANPMAVSRNSNTTLSWKVINCYGAACSWTITEELPGSSKVLPGFFSLEDSTTVAVPDNIKFTLKVDFVGKPSAVAKISVTVLPVSSRFISVSKEGAGGSAVFIVTGEGFTSNSLVVIKITATNFAQVQFAETTGGDGKFVSRHSVPCQSGQQLTVTAFEDANPSGTFANAVVTSCP